MKLTHFAQALTLTLVAVTAYLAWNGQGESARAYAATNARLDRLAQAQQAQQAMQPIQMPAGSVPPPLTAQPAAAAVADASLVPTLSAPRQATTLSPAVPFTPAVPATPAVPLTPIASLTSASKTVASGFGMAGAPTTIPMTPEPPTSGLAGSAPTLPAAPAPVSLTPTQRLVKGAPALGKVTAVVKEHGFVTLNAGKSKQVTVGMKFDLRREAGVVGRIQITEVEEGESIADLDPKSVPSGVDVQQGDDVIQVVQSR